MCGIFGVVRPSGVTPIDERRFTALGDQLLHRGPDGSGFIEDARALLGMHRLSIMDPTHGWQPFWSEDGRWGVLGNGEIYNARTLRADLETRGHTLATGSDIEVVPHLLEEHGPASFVKLRGMFALAIIDRRDGVILLVRDRMGEKPLSYVEDQGAIFISSEQTALVRSGVIGLSVDRLQLPGYLLHGFVPEPRSLLAGVRKVPAAHYVRISLDDGVLSEHRYWDPIECVGDADVSPLMLREALEDSIVSTCTSDVPVGIALSGGLDSSLVAAVAAKARTDIRAFTIGYVGNGPDESVQAQSLAAHLGIPCLTTTLRTEDIAADFADVCGARDEPVSDIAGPALDAVPKAAREDGVPVLLTGIGGDELFWGYDWVRQLAVWSSTYLEERSAGSNISRPRFSPFPRARQARVDWGLSLGGRRTDAQMRRFVSDHTGDAGFPLPFYEFQPGHRALWKAMRELHVSTEGRAVPEFRAPAKAEWIGAAYTIASNETYLRVNSFVQVDRLAMRHSIESRTPLADGDLMATVLSGRLRDRDQFLPPKARLRQIAYEILPAEIVERPKRGFTPPVRDWARAIWAKNAAALSGDALVSMTGLPPDPTARWMRSPTDRMGRVNQVALRLITLELWLRSLS